MPFTPTFQNAFPTVGASADVWGGILNARGGESYVDFQAIATVLNATEAKVDDALLRSGGTMTGNITLPMGASASSAEAGFKGAPISALTPGGTKTLASSDAGLLQTLASGGHTLTIAPGLPLGMVVPIKNLGSGTITIARGSGVTLALDGTNTNKNCTVFAYGKAVLTHNALNVWSISGVGVS